MIILNNVLIVSIFLFNKINFISKTIYSNKNDIIRKNYKNPTINIDLKNNLDYFLNKKTKVYIHLEQLIPYTNIYHIGITFKRIFRTIRYDLRWINIPLVNNITTNSYKIFWDYSDYTIKEIIDYENSLEFKYILGVYDCRHYVRNLTTWSCNNPTPIWKLINYIDYIDYNENNENIE